MGRVTSKDKIRQALADGQPKGFSRLMLDTGLSAATLNTHLSEMLNAGELTGVYQNEMMKLKVSTSLEAGNYANRKVSGS